MLWCGGVLALGPLSNACAILSGSVPDSSVSSTFSLTSDFSIFVCASFAFSGDSDSCSSVFSSVFAAAFVCSLLLSPAALSSFAARLCLCSSSDSSARFSVALFAVAICSRSSSAILSSSSCCSFSFFSVSSYLCRVLCIFSFK